MPQQPNPIGRQQPPASPQRNGGGPAQRPVFSPPQMFPNQTNSNNIVPNPQNYPGGIMPNYDVRFLGTPQQGTGGPFQIPGRPPLQRQGFIRPNIFPQMHPGWAGYLQWLQSMRR